MTKNDSVLLLDVMGTLVYEPFYRDVPAFFGMALADLLQVKHPTSWVEFESGSLSEEEFYMRFFEDSRVFDHEGLANCMRSAYRFIDGAEDLLRDLQAAGVEMHLFSNYPIWYRWIEEKLALSRYAKWSFVSCETKVRKPDAAAYQGAMRTLEVGAERLILVDDRPENCQAAQRLGMGAEHFTGVPALRLALTELGLLGGQMREA